MPGAGRQQGTPNKNKERLLNALKKEYGDDFEPIMFMAKNAKAHQVITENAIRNNEERDTVVSLLEKANAQWDRVAKYTTPQLKAIEHRIDEEGPLAVFITRNAKEPE